MPYLPEAQHTPWQQSEEVDLTRTAVLVIDVLGGSGGVVPGLEEMAENAVRIVKAARKAGVPVVFVNDAHIAGIDKEIELWGEHGIAGSDAARPIDAFEVQEGDYIIPKRRYDGFFQTDLRSDAARARRRYPDRFWLRYQHLRAADARGRVFPRIQDGGSCRCVRDVPRRNAGAGS